MEMSNAECKKMCRDGGIQHDVGHSNPPQPVHCTGQFTAHKYTSTQVSCTCTAQEAAQRREKKKRRKEVKKEKNKKKRRNVEITHLCKSEVCEKTHGAVRNVTAKQSKAKYRHPTLSLSLSLSFSPFIQEKRGTKERGNEGEGWRSSALGPLSVKQYKYVHTYSRLHGVLRTCIIT